jgi:two-component system cell cycle sensor histidine kinase/response regulator CckA
LPAAPTSSSTAPAVVASGSSRGHETILLVEDESAVRSLVARVLRRKGYTVLEASNGLEALGVYERHAGPVDIVVADVVMPEMPGPQLVGRLRERAPNLRILYMSGYASDQMPVYASDQMPVIGDDAFIEKPFTLDALAEKVREVLE